MKKTLLILMILTIAVISTACINNMAVQELNNKANAFMQSGDYESAINRLEASLDLDNTIFETHYNLGVAYLKVNKYKESIDSLENAIKIRADVADTYYSLAVAKDSYAQYLLNLEDTTAVEQQSNEEVVENKTEAQNPDMLLSKDERKGKAIELYKSAIVSYHKYLELAGDNTKDSDQINTQIKGIEEEVQKTESDK